MVDMETWALVRAAQTFGLPLVALRGVSDGKAELTGLHDWTSTLHLVDENLAQAVDGPNPRPIARPGFDLMTQPTQHQKVLIVDFGSQVTQLIARRLREAGVYCEIHPFNKAGEALKAMQPQAIILSGGPNSTTDADSPRVDHAVFDYGAPILGICYGEQLICAELGGKVESGHHAEFGRAEIVITKDSPLFAGIGALDHREP
ncbi:hypothetical protein LTR94_030431, partial [Friedmanniomyces endolithicus]